MASSKKVGAQKYKKQQELAERATAVSTKAKKKTAKEAEVHAAIEKAATAKKSAAQERKTQAATEKEILKQTLVPPVPVTASPGHNKLVRDDFSPTNSNRDTLVVEYAPLIKFIAQKIASRLPANIELDDLISSGVIGLMDAIEKYDSTRDNKFKTYAEFRIRGAILDELRSQDWVPRSVREKAKILERAYMRIEQLKGRQATDEEISIELGVTHEEFHELLNDVKSVSLLSYDDLGNLSNSDKRALHGFGESNSRMPTPFSAVSLAYVKKLVAEAIEDLPEKQRLVLSLYYYEDLNLKEIGNVLDVTESRVSQLHSQAILKLKARLKNHWDDFVSLMNV